jgi:threonine dehydrogenase-like Zn-dependent dehydrogenase
MRAWVLEPELRFEAVYPTPAPPPGECLIRVHVAGICNTDLELLRGYQAFGGVPGHEFVGTVVQAPGAERWEGRRVVGDINAACGTCATCRAGRPTHCPHRTTLGIQGRDGALAEYLVLPVANLYPVPEGLPDAVAVFAEPLAAACEILEQVHVRPTDRVVVLGDGKLGLLCAQVVALTGCDLLAVGHHREKLALLERRGIVTALEQEADVGDADVVIEATGHPDGYAAARRLVRARGTVVLKSTYHGAIDADLTGVVVDEVRLVGSRCGPFAPALRLLARGWVAVVPLVEARYPLAKGRAALEHAARPGALKVLVTPPAR